MKASGESAQIYEIKITLKGLKPTIWRRVRVRSDITLAALHDVIQTTMGWTDSHLHAFEIGGERFANPGMVEDLGDRMADERRVRLNQIVAPRSRFVYRYDFGDDWEHEVKVEKTVDLSADAKTPRCVAGARACPPEDCGGTWGYAEMLERLTDPADEERDELIEWLGEEFDPQRFELREVNEILQQLDG